ncbi:hypothetical protein AMECASPLE_038400 [Ameca splendens]|uniref:Uncharacterized protein n=1 Tax=Ameca splendens TaxID=208324 RepID=A0ABV0XLB8_9TELE
MSVITWEVPAGHSLSGQERNFILDQNDLNTREIKEEPEPHGLKEEQVGLYIVQNEKQLVVKQEVETFRVSHVYLEKDISEPEKKMDQLLFLRSPKVGNQHQQAMFAMLSFNNDAGSQSAN